MEYLLSTAFDQLSSYDPSAIRRGLRHIEGLLAHICRPNSSASPKKSSSGVDNRVTNDPAYEEFLRLQDGFEWNIALRLVSCLERLLGQDQNELTTLLILSTLDLLQGVLLVHPPSRHVFAREINMTILLDMLEPQSSTPSIQGATVSTLVCALVEEWSNVRTFEALDGLSSICALFRRKDTDKEVKLKVLEFLFCYLMPELESSQTESPQLGRRSSESGSDDSKASKTSISSNGSTDKLRTTQEKQKLLGRYLNNVDSLVKELRNSRPFGNLDI
ncbi:cell division protein Cdc14 [Lipomyces arxii]|uniref:cell division protein Cdc14 n=1 Tax=Lipomyces arxii TaxID=56418 RepID=UPI0034CDA8FF